PYNNPSKNNPTLFQALRQVGFGPVVETQTASGTGKPLFQFVSFGNIVVANGPTLQATAACTRNGVPLKTCQTTPTLSHQFGRTILGWNWSTNKSANVMFVGDAWTASFNVVATGPPYATVPVDACVGAFCYAGGSTALNGLFSWATYVPYTNNSVITASFPLGQVQVQFTPPPLGAPAPPPAPPPPPPGVPIPAPLPVPITQSIGIGQSVGVGNVALQGVAAGFLGAGFMKVSQRNRPIAMAVAAKSGVRVRDARSRFEKGMSTNESSLGRFE
ncbi:MAG TPA: hypothetical protein VFF67_03680, partial [Thermoplasmata archaeon]|nr:hypothetical protein [Thermoplasmata archaeon]